MKEKINVTIEEEVVREVDRWAAKFELSRSQMVQNLLIASLADVKLLKKLGFMELASSIIKLQNKLKVGLQIP